MNKKLGLALGAGGSRGVAHVGFLQALEEAGIRPDCVSGCSMGSIIGVCYCAGTTPEQMKQAVLGLKLTDITAINVSPVRRNGLFKMTKARKMMVDFLGGEKDFSDLKIPFQCVATDLELGKAVYFSEGSAIDAALASSSIPGVFTPASVGEHKLLLDGGIVERVPTDCLRDMGAEVIVAVDVLGDLMREKEVKGTLIDTVLRVYDIMDTRNTQRMRRNRKYVDLWLEPDLGGMDQYRVKDLDFAYEKGYELGVQNRDRIGALLG